MATSPDNTVNLHPERRTKTDHSPRSTSNAQYKHEKTETSPFFAPSRPSEKPKPRDDDEQQEQSNSPDSRSPKPTKRQMLLSFTPKGTLTTKQPLSNPTPRTDKARLSLAEVAQETISLLPGLLATRPDVGRDGHLIKFSPPVLDPSTGPGLAQTSMCVLDADSITAALSLPSLDPSIHPPPLILNMANANHAGGGFKHGALAQEEALCYRSSLFFTLKIKHYPIPETGAIYSPKVLVIREDMANGHNLLDLRDPSELPVVSVISAAAICLPETKKIMSSSTGKQQYTYARPSDRQLMKTKMRTILRVAAWNGHRQIVLGAFGCGAFRNPSQEVAEMWKGVFLESEFRDGGWWKDVVFAVLGQGTENFEVFERVLGGLGV